MKRPRRPLFLARAPYRRRRLRDAARLLPILGALFLLLPLLWREGSELHLTSGDVVYFFSLWIALIGAAAAFAPGLRGGEGSDEDDD